MPISVDELRSKGTEPMARQSHTKDAVVNHLKENTDSAFTTKEIADELELNNTTVNQILRKLNEKELTVRKDYDGVRYNAWVGGDEEEVEDEE